MFGSSPAQPTAAAAGEIGAAFQPKQGAYFRTLDYPETDENNVVIGRVWMEAGFDPANKSWVLWRKSLKEMADPMTGRSQNVLAAKALFDKTDFVTAYDQMTTYELSQQTLGVAPLSTKTPGKLGGDYFKQFAWREGLMMSSSGRLYPVDGKVYAANFFNEQDIKDAATYLARLEAEKFTPVPIVLAKRDWAEVYDAFQERADERLNALYHRFGGARDNIDLALQIVGEEAPEVLYAHLKRGFSPNIFESEPEKHFALVKAAIDRPEVDALQLLSGAGVSFTVRHIDDTPLELALRLHRYSHLHVMLSRDGAELANYLDKDGNAPAVLAMELQDRQAFHMLYLEGLDYAQVDQKGYALVHHAFERSFVSGVYAWIDEGLSIDTPIKGTEFTGLSIARRKHDQPMIDFAVAHGANPAAPDFPAATPAPVATPAPPAPATPDPVKDAGPAAFTPDMLNTAATNKEIEAAAAAHAAAGGTFEAPSSKGVPLFELCWKNRKPKPEFDRRALIPVFGRLGADASAPLADGTTILTRIAAAGTFDLDYLKAVAPFAKDPSATDANGNNILHALQKNASETVSHSNNVSAVLKLFPALDLNRQTADGFSNVGLAIRLNRAQTLKVLPPALAAKTDWSLMTSGGWSMLDIAFTNAAGLEKVAGAPRADKILAASDATRGLVLDMVERAPLKQALSDVFNRRRPDGKTLTEALAAEGAPATTVSRLTAACKI